MCTIKHFRNTLLMLFSYMFAIIRMDVQYLTFTYGLLLIVSVFDCFIVFSCITLTLFFVFTIK